MSEKILMKVVGHNGQIELFNTKIRIKRKGFVASMTQRLKDDREIPIGQISSIHFKKAGYFLNGFIRFNIVGRSETNVGFWQAEHDENTILFTIKQQPAFEKINDFLDKKIILSKKKKVELSKLKLEELTILRDMKIITEKEFQAEKKKLLGS